MRCKPQGLQADRSGSGRETRERVVGSRYAARAIGLAALCVASLPGLASANAILDVNRDLIDAFRNPALHVTPPPSAAYIAFAGIAMYDAVNAATGLGYKPYSYAGGTVAGVQADAAAYSAGYTVLSSLFPAMTGTYQATLQAKLDALGLPSSTRTASEAFGSTIATTYLASRANDGRATAQVAYADGVLPGEYKRTPGVLNAIVPHWGEVTPFVMTSVDQFSVAKPPAIGSPEWIAAYNEVLSKGCVNCSQTPAELELSRFWSDIVNTQLPPGHWLAILDTLAAEKGLSVLETARLTALLGVAVGDASIKTWNVKYLEDDLTWRPYTAITECTVAACGVAGDPSWQSLWASPPFPGYISGHSTFSEAAATILADYFGDDTPFCSTADPNAGFGSPVTRCFDSFSTAAAEAGESRIMGGIHFSFDNIAGLAVGKQIADYDFANAFTSVPEPGSLLLLGTAATILGSRLRGRVPRRSPRC